MTSVRWWAGLSRRRYGYRVTRSIGSNRRRRATVRVPRTAQRAAQRSTYAAGTAARRKAPRMAHNRLRWQRRARTGGGGFMTWLRGRR